ncbi:hypothetical protein FRB94_001362 [Tulasnella sp. JGI-2019a]|nr:hypothetical protein FRB93_000635 [Tulasnella sp. JGI-2019a]KAG9005719.1 hypothetical protein FRB94_001362 [Tulasnella sp. JGI-2019a]KAG9034985.1 hypothetical protein FRB95_012275 [Tulasnella sp. JGI-2019a]
MTQEHAQYAAANAVPLIKSPSLRVPKPVEMPEDMYPLPSSIAEYFAYPFTLEPHVVTLESARQSTVAAHAARRESYLKMRDEEKARRKKDALRRVAPGFEPDSGPMVPRRIGELVSKRIDELAVKSGSEGPGVRREVEPQARSVMDDLVDQLAAMNK